MSKAINVLIALILISGIALLLYPTVSDQYSQFVNNRRILSYDRDIVVDDSGDNAALLEAARAYNAGLRSAVIRDAFGDDGEAEGQSEYQALLNPGGDGVMGVVEIPKIGVRLPIYHGTGSESLARGAGHIEGTSLPVGGESTHCGIAGHRGLPSARLFTDLDRLENGDVIYLNVLGELLVYQVDQISVVLPNETDAMSVVDGGDYLTLVTCTPYGVNSHRLLVRGRRTSLSALASVLAFEDSAERCPDWQGALVCAVPVAAVGLLLMLLIRPKRKFELR